MRIVLVLLFSVLFFSCKKESINGGEKVEFYLLQSFRTVGFKCQVDEASAILQNDAFITNEEIISYNRSKYSFTLKESAINKIKAIGGRIPFALTVDKKVIYFGYYMPNIMSSTCEHSITFDVISSSKIKMALGYPFDYKENIDDKRNDGFLLNILKKQGKLR